MNRESNCGSLFHSCVCDREPSHDGPHACLCGGSWEKDGTIVHLPKTVDVGPNMAERQAFVDLFARWLP